MKNELIELSYRQVGAASRFQIIINKSTVTIRGKGGWKRTEFVREERTSRVLWDKIGQQIESIKKGELQSMAKLKSKTSGTHAIISMQTRDYAENSPLFSELDISDNLQSLIKSIFSAQSLLEEIIYNENGMSESLKINIRREEIKLNSTVASLVGDSQTNSITPADYWDLLTIAIKDIKIEKLQNIKAPSNRRAADTSLYASIKIFYGGQLYEASSFDDNPPKQLQKLIELVKLAKTDSTIRR